MQRPTDHEVDFVELVAQIQSGSEAGVVGLYRLFSAGLRAFLVRQIGGQDSEDRLHEILLIVLDAIRKGQLRDPQKLLGFVWTVARRQITLTIQERTVSRRRDCGLEFGVQISEIGENPEMEAISFERAEIARRALLSLSPLNHEILNRFYLKEQTQEQICRDLNLTDTQFRLRKSRAKAQFGQFGRTLAAKRHCDDKWLSEVLISRAACA
jgi:RNA polymerase sigma-70 factor, ECF subfamily